jgi:hypothetical protein
MDKIKSEKVTATNAWGFNGWTGTRDTYVSGLLELVHEYGIWQGRHTQSSFRCIRGRLAGMTWHSDHLTGADGDQRVAVWVSAGMYPHIEPAGRDMSNFLGLTYTKVYEGTLEGLAKGLPEISPGLGN